MKRSRYLLPLRFRCRLCPLIKWNGKGNTREDGQNVGLDGPCEPLIPMRKFWGFFFLFVVWGESLFELMILYIQHTNTMILSCLLNHRFHFIQYDALFVVVHETLEVWTKIHGSTLYFLGEGRTLHSYVSEEREVSN